MNVPDTLLFKELLASLTLTPPSMKESYDKVVAIPPKGARDDKGRQYFYDEVNLWCKRQEKAGINTIINKIQEVLTKAGHFSNKQIAISVLCLFCFHHKQKADPVGTINEMLSLVEEADASQFYIFPTPSPEGYGLKLGPFIFGKLNCEKLQYRCKKAMSDYYERYAESIKGRCAIEREIISLKFIAWHKLAGAFRCVFEGDSLTSDPVYFMTFNYYEKLNEVIWKDFWDEIYNQQVITTAAGCDYFDERQFKQMLGSETVSVFINKNSPGGFVAPAHNGLMHIEWGGTDERLEKMLKTLEIDYSAKELSDCELHSVLKVYSSFAAKAIRETQDDKLNEAFLDFVIALDFLLGDSAAAVASVSERTAILTFKKFKVSYLDQKKLIQKIYKQRSDYVHHGESVDLALLEQVKLISKEVLFVILRLNKEPKNRSSDFVESWRKKLDFLVHAVQADEEVSSDKYVAVGVG